MKPIVFALLLLSAAMVLAAPPRLAWAEPKSSIAQSSLAAEIRREVEGAIADKKLPGCVILVSSRGAIVHREAYGSRQLEPATVAMTADTVFDLASLTKPIATATSVMILIERGKLNLEDPVAKHLPEFSANAKSDITVEHLLLHTAGLIADNPLSDYDDGPEKARERILALKPLAAPGERFIYSDMCFVTLGMLVEKVSGQPLDAFASENIFKPLAMHETGFKPEDQLRKRAAPTEKRDEKWLVGEVHDPRAAKLGGVAGHAGVFSTADDLAKYAQAMLDRARHGDARLMSEETWRLMTRPRAVPRDGRRGLGWDIRTGYSTNRGKNLSDAAFGHGGFTGTALWIDPEKQLFVIFLSNRLHPDGKGSVNPLAGRIADVVAEALGQASTSR
jgi:CubicO group peptidase (beta-lactamase class C family)